MGVFVVFKMITLDFSTFVIGFIAIGLLFFGMVWIYYDRRDRQFYDRQRIRHIHHCVKCGRLYASMISGEGEECPDCGFRNASLRF